MKSLERRIRRQESRLHVGDVPPWELEGREPDVPEQMLWYFHTGGTLEQLVEESFGGEPWPPVKGT